MTSHKVSEEGAEAGPSIPKIRYEPPMLIALGNLRDVVAGTTQNLLCDGGVLTGDGNTNLGC
jgi:hypothetical protein